MVHHTSESMSLFLLQIFDLNGRWKLPAVMSAGIFWYKYLFIIIIKNINVAPEGGLHCVKICCVALLCT
jgi:hypothetical protein